MLRFKYCKLLGMLILFALLLAKTARADTAAFAPNPIDPYETYNRHAYHLNKAVDNAVFKPVATVYNKILPWFVRKGVNNFFKNINTIPTIINDMLQGSLYHTAADTTRLVVNTTLGIGGLIDVATAGGVAPHKEDFGLTLDRWGYKSSAYFVIPILGPSTVRDTIGLVMDYNVFNIYLFLPWRINFALWAINAVDVRAQLLEFDDVLKQASLDPYTFQRNAYLQHRAAVIAENDADLDGKAPGEIGNDSLADSYVP